MGLVAVLGTWCRVIWQKGANVSEEPGTRFQGFAAFFPIRAVYTQVGCGELSETASVSFRQVKDEVAHTYKQQMKLQFCIDLTRKSHFSVTADIIIYLHLCRIVGTVDRNNGYRRQMHLL